ncbi:MAG: hypothetical protein F6K16_43090, partial [Symploca sp. SIO2B6]|nr:hypothetical protein [Symploca sp. SIO2B6]
GGSGSKLVFHHHEDDLIYTFPLFSDRVEGVIGANGISSDADCEFDQTIDDLSDRATTANTYRTQTNFKITTPLS